MVIKHYTRCHFYNRIVHALQGDTPVVRLIKRVKGQEEILAEQPVSAQRLYLKIEAVEQEYNFFFATAAEVWQPLQERVDGRILSTEIAGGFVGAYIGMYASSNGRQSTNVADFDWFEYVGKEVCI